MENNISGLEILEHEIEELEKQGIQSLPSLNHFLETKKLYITKNDIRILRQLLKTKKFKLIKVTDYMIVRRGKRK